MGKSKAPKVPENTTSTTTVAPWSKQAPYLKKLFSEAARLYNEYNPQYFPGEQIAGFTDPQVAAQNRLLGYSNEGAQDLANAGMDANLFALGPVLFPETNPALREAAEGAVRPLFQNLTESVLPAIRGGAIGSGQYGSSRQGIAEGLAAGRTMQAAGQATADLYNRGYQSGLDAFIRGLALSPATMQLGATPSLFQEAVGAQQRALEQDLINAEIQKWNWQQMLPYMKLDEYGNQVAGQFGSSATATIPGGGIVGRANTNPFMSGLSGAAAGAYLGSSLGLGSALGLGASAGGAIGAGIGLLVGLIG